MDVYSEVYRNYIVSCSKMGFLITLLTVEKLWILLGKGQILSSELVKQ
jgi:hypothetical protein